MSKSINRSIRLAVIGTLALTGMLFGSIASAASVTYYLDQSNSLANGIDYASVTLKDGADASDAEYVDVTVEVIASAFGAVGDNFGMDKFFFNYDNSLTVDASNIIDIDPASWDINLDKNAGGSFGFFDFELKGAGNSRTLVLNFSIAGVAGDGIADYAIAGAEGMFYSAHIGGFGGDGELSTIVAGPNPVPVPAALWLLGSALGGLGFMRRRKA